MKSMIVLLTIMALGVGISACGNARTGLGAHSKSVRNTSVSGRQAVDAVSAGVSTDGSREANRVAHYRGDGDNDPANDNDTDDHNGSKFDDDRDSREDAMHPENDKYHDRDDYGVVTLGQPANMVDTRTVRAVTMHYYELAARRDGGKACLLLASALRESMVEDYGQPPGPEYLRGTTCRAVLVKLFTRQHEQAVARYVVTGVRVKGDQAYAFLGSGTMPASYIILRRQGDGWTIGMPFGVYLP